MGSISYGFRSSSKRGGKTSRTRDLFGSIFFSFASTCTSLSTVSVIPRFCSSGGWKIFLGAGIDVLFFPNTLLRFELRLVVVPFQSLINLSFSSKWQIYFYFPISLKVVKNYCDRVFGVNIYFHGFSFSVMIFCKQLVVNHGLLGLCAHPDSYGISICAPCKLDFGISIHFVSTGNIKQAIPIN